MLSFLVSTCCLRSSELSIAYCKNVRGLRKRMVVFDLFEKLRYSENERSTKSESLSKDRSI